MNRDYIVEQDIISRYVAGTLPTDEAQDFELAFFNDHELAALVLVEHRLREALAPNGSARRRTTQAGADSTRSPRRPRLGRRGVLARALALAAVALPATWLVGQWSGDARNGPRALTQVLSLHTTRSAAGSGPSLPMPTARDAIIALHIDDSQVPDGARRALLIQEGLAPQPLVEFDRDGDHASNGLIIEVPAKLLTPGPYLLELQDSDANTLLRLPFRITLPDF